MNQFAPPQVFNTVDKPLAPEFANLPPMTRDQALVEWDKAKKMKAAAEEREMQLRKFCVAILPQTMAMAQPLTEGTNNFELGNGYVAKAVIKFNRKLDSDTKKVQACADAMTRVSNEGGFIADRLFNWKVDISVTELKKLEEEAKLSLPHRQMLELVNGVLTMSPAAPTLEIKEPKAKR